MKTVVLKLNRFNEGISDDVREQVNGVFTITKNFDIFSHKKKLSPYRDTEELSGITSTSTSLTSHPIENLTYDNSALYALAQLSPSFTARFRILQATDPSGSSSEIWAFASTASQTTIGSASFSTFASFKSYLWGIKTSGAGTSGKSDVWRWGTFTGTKTLSEAYGGADVLTGTGGSISTQGNGIVGDDDNLYLPYGNNLCKIDGATLAVTAERLSVPSDFTISSLTKWGKYMAIGCYPSNNNGNSRMFLWDYVSDDVTEAYDFGKGNLKVLENVDGVLIGVVDLGLSLATAIYPKVQIVSWNGGSPEVIKELRFTSSFSVLCAKQKIGNKLYFILHDGTTYGVWVVGRRTRNDPWGITFDRYLSNDTLITNAPKNFFFLGDFLFVSLSDGNLRRTVNQNAGAYTSTSIYKSQKLNADDLSKVKEIKAVALTTVPIPSGGSAKLDYRVNATSSSDLTSTWTNVFNETTTGRYYHEASKVEAINREFEQGNELEFRVRSTGFVEPVDLKVVLEVIDDQVEE